LCSNSGDVNISRFSVDTLLDWALPYRRIDNRKLPPTQDPSPRLSPRRTARLG
jgi:hypothetical protein